MADNDGPYHAATLRPEALRACLDELQVHARRAGFDLSAHLIGVASEALTEEMVFAEARRRRQQ